MTASGTPGIIQFFGSSSALDSSSLFQFDKVGARLAIGTTSTSSTLTIQGQVGTANLLTVSSSSGATLLALTPAGNLAVGTSNPISRLQVEGATSASGANAIASIYSSSTLSNTTASGFEFGNRFLNTVNGSATGTYDGLFVRMTDSTSNATNTVRGIEVQAYSGTNTAGINAGITAFGKTFGVQGITTGEAGGTVAPAGVYAELQHPTNGNALRVYSATATSATLLSVYQETSAYTGNALTIDLGNNSGSFASGTFINLKVAGASKFSVNQAGKVTATGGFNGQCLSSGNFGSSTSGSCNMDVAEIYHASEAVGAGDVLTADLPANLETSTSTPYVKRSTKAYDPHVLGVVSTAPGLILGLSHGDVLLGGDSTVYINNPAASTSPAVALTGRVPVKVTNENGNIEPGDFLTSSAQFPGYAMKATRSGYVLGQALEGFSSDASSSAGNILVYISPGFESINNTFVLGDDDGQLTNATSTQGATTSLATSFLIDQKGSGNILQLQAGEQDRFLVASSGSLSILANVSTTSTSSVLSVINGSSTLFSINSVGDAQFTGHIIVDKDTAGTATIKTGDNQTTVTFDAPYNSIPKIIATVNGVPSFFYGVINKSATGFTIAANQPMTEDTTFDWVALEQPNDTASESSINLSVISAQGGTATVTSGGGSSSGSTSTPPPAPAADAGTGSSTDGSVAGTSTPPADSTVSSGSTDSTPPADTTAPPADNSSASTVTPPTDTATTPSPADSSAAPTDSGPSTSQTPDATPQG